MDWICSLLAIWHFGATYTPLDFRVTESLSRLAVIPSAARPSSILRRGATESKTPELNYPAKVINVSGLRNNRVDFTATKAKGTVAAAVLFTSGTTGVLKGVILQQKYFRGLDQTIPRSVCKSPTAGRLDLQLLTRPNHHGSFQCWHRLVVSKQNRSDPSAIADHRYRGHHVYACNALRICQLASPRQW